MIAEYNKWYKCEKGTMPEDFDNLREPYVPERETITLVVSVHYANTSFIDSGFRRKENEGIYHWRGLSCSKGCSIEAWMLPKPYKE